MTLKNITIHIFGSKTFYRMIIDLDIFKKVLDDENINVEQDNQIYVVFLEHTKPKVLFKIINSTLPSIIVSNQHHYIKKKFKPSNFSVFLNTPIEIQNFFEIIKIILSKYNYFKSSEIFFNEYCLNANNRFIERNKKKIKLTEKELNVILFIKNFNGVSKADIIKNIWKYENNLETHAFETTIYRLRKKIKDNFYDNDFIAQKDGRYYLVKS